MISPAEMHHIGAICLSVCLSVTVSHTSRTFRSLSQRLPPGGYTTRWYYENISPLPAWLTVRFPAQVAS